MCNEEGRQGSPQGAQFFTAMMQTCPALDTTRPISSAMNGGWFEPESFTKVEDLMGVNYISQRLRFLSQAHPQMPMFGSETASTLTTRGEYADNKGKTWSVLTT